MKKSLLLNVLFFLLFISACQKEDALRNPFGVEDVVDPFGEDVLSFYQSLILPFSDDSDPNATRWVVDPLRTYTSIFGDWSSRWNGGGVGSQWVTGSSQIKEKDGFVYILHEDATNRYLTEARFENDSTLIGRYINLGKGSDATPWVGIIKSHSRIDGVWAKGRWDYQR